MCAHPSTPPLPDVFKHTCTALLHQTRFLYAPGQSIRKLVGKIRSASAERKARQRAKRSPSPSYQKGHVIDNIQQQQTMERQQRRGASPVHRYYLGEDPFGGSIYGRENKYDGVRPARSSRRQQYSREEDDGGR